MAKEMMEGNIAMAEMAIRGGCRAFFGYPITPQSPFLEYMSERMREVGGEFCQCESEIASSNMLMGAAAAGARVCTATAGMGVSLMMEALSWAGAGLYPGVIVFLSRGGAGASGGGPSQQDYNYFTKTMGHGGFPPYVIAPSTVQEAADIMYDAFDLADKYRTLVVVFTDAMVGQVMEPVELKPFKTEFPTKNYYVGYRSDGGDRRIIANAIRDENKYGAPANRRFEAMYETWKNEEVKYEEYKTDDAEVILIAYGTAARICRGAIDDLREEGYKVGMFRPITLNPFPVHQIEAFDNSRIRQLVVAEVCVPPQMVNDVKLANAGRIPVASYAKSWSEIFSTEDVVAELKKYF